MYFEWHDFFEILQRVGELGFKFIVGDLFDVAKILLSILATVYFGRKYVQQHLRRLLEREIGKIAEAEQMDRGHVLLITNAAVKKAQGTGDPSFVFGVRTAFDVAARYCAQRQTADAIELLDRETLLSRGAADLLEKRATAARVKAATAQLQIGLISRSQGDTVAALAAFKSMVDVHPDDVDGLRFAGQELESQGRLSEARERYERLEQIAIGTDDKILLGESLRSLARVNDSFRDALAVLDECLALEKSIHHDLGLAYTWKTIADIRTRAAHWQIAQEAYDNALRLFGVLNHDEARQEAQQAKDWMLEARAQARVADLESTAL